jgi:hypothetical protein
MSESEETVNENERFLGIQSDDTLMKMTDREQVQIQ